MSAPSAALREASGASVRSFAAVTAILAAVVLFFWSTSSAMVATWNSSGNYSHGFLVVPAFVWLVWRRRHELARLPIEPSWWALLPLAAVGALWLAGHWMALALPAELAIVAMVPLAVASTLGIAWVQALAFPLAFLFFAVPLGESLVPTLMDWTADFTVVALKLSGVPVYRDGLHFEIPSGRWSVVDSCSGIRYLFACLATSSLYAWVIYRSTVRRLTFVGLSALIAVLANWLRAYGIVMLGHLSNNEIATGTDHLIYGGLFFAFVMALIVLLGALWREDSRPEAPPPAAALAQPRLPGPARDRGGRIKGALATLAMLSIWPAISLGSGSPRERLVVAPGLQPQAGWVETTSAPSTWRPVLRNPVAVSSQAFTKDGESVGVYIGLYASPTSESKLTSAMNRFVVPDGLDPHWKLALQEMTDARIGARRATIYRGVVVGREARLLAWQWYWVDGVATANAFAASARQFLARLRGRSDVSAWIAVYTRESETTDEAARVLHGFLADMSGSIESALQEAADERAMPRSHP